MIKAFIFDVGGVLIRTEDYTHRRNLEKRLGLADWESETLVFSGKMGTKAQMGAISYAELWAWIGEELSLAPDALKQFRAEFFGGDVLDKTFIELIRSLRPRFKTAIISNAADNLRHALTAVYPIADAFDLIVCSAEEKIMKPDAEIYERTLARLDCRPEETVFVDDFAHNIEAARALGMNAIHFKPGIDIGKELNRYASGIA